MARRRTLLFSAAILATLTHCGPSLRNLPAAYAETTCERLAACGDSWAEDAETCEAAFSAYFLEYERVSRSDPFEGYTGDIQAGPYTFQGRFRSNPGAGSRNKEVSLETLEAIELAACGEPLMIEVSLTRDSFWLYEGPEGCASPFVGTVILAR